MADPVLVTSELPEDPERRKLYLIGKSAQAFAEIALRPRLMNSIMTDTVESYRTTSQIQMSTAGQRGFCQQQPLELTD